MKTETLPKGTTQEEWDTYAERLAKHNEFIRQYNFFLNRIVTHLNWKEKGKAWTVEEIMKVIGSEIQMASSCDAPNKPGYYRANND